MSDRYAIKDDQWSRIEHLLPGRAGHPGARARDNRLFVNAVLHLYRAGIPWRDLPEHFGDFRVVHLRHSRWSKSGVRTRVFEVLAQDADNKYVMVDLIIDHCSGASAQRRGQKKGTRNDQAIGRSRGGLTTKIHATVDALGNLTEFHLTAGQAHDLHGCRGFTQGHASPSSHCRQGV